MNNEIAIKIEEVSGVSFTSEIWNSSVESLIRGGWNIDEEKIAEILAGNTVTVYGVNRKLYITKK
jgi:hypothetical protein